MKNYITKFIRHFEKECREIPALNALYCADEHLKEFSMFYKIIIIIARFYGYRFERLPHSVDREDGYLLKK